MGHNQHNQNGSPLSRVILLVVLLIFLGPAAISIIGAGLGILVSLTLVLLVVALVLLASPILMLYFPASAAFHVPQMALFFFGIAVLALFVLAVAVVLKFIKWLFLTIIRGIRRILGYS